MIRELFHDFLNKWNEDKIELTERLNDNKKFNKKLKLGQIPGGTYPKDKKAVSVYEHPTVEIIAKQIPDRFYNLAEISEKEYLIEGSVGLGNISEVPWICIFDRHINNPDSRQILKV